MEPARRLINWTTATIGASIRVVVSYTNGNGHPESIASAATAPVANVNEPAGGTVPIGGTAAVDLALTASANLSDHVGLGTLHYQWQHDGGSGFTDIGTDQSTYTPVSGDIGDAIRVVVKATPTVTARSSR